ncbi:MAG: HPr-rel-A system PqqD family peptide chaperone [Candidatus Reddybacter sp.]
MWASVSWFVDPANPVFFGVWPGENTVVAYQSTSGDTHMISAMGAAVLELLQTGPLSVEAIFAELFPDDALEVTALNHLRNNFLIHFEQLGLIKKTLS